MYGVYIKVKMLSEKFVDRLFWPFYILAIYCINKNLNILQL